jgi:hypothetical protein
MATKFMQAVTITPLKQTSGENPNDKTKVIKLNRWRISRLKEGEKHSGSLTKPDFCIIAAPEQVKECPVKAGNWVECELRHPTAANGAETANYYHLKTFADAAAKNAYIDQSINEDIDNDVDYQVELRKAEKLAIARSKSARQFSVPTDLAAGA